MRTARNVNLRELLTNDRSLKKLSIFSVKYLKAGAGEFVTEWRFAEVGEKEFMACMNISDMEAMGAFMSSPEELQWDKDNGCEYTVYGMEEMTE